MKIVKFFILLITLNSLPLFAQTDENVKMEQYAAEYAKCESVSNRLQLANKFFAYLRDIEYIDEPIVFPAGSHIDSVDVNVYYYVAEWYYGEAD